MEERFATIERDNRILLEKMSYIMQHNTLDNKNTSTQYGHSLNKESRKRDLQRITAENQVSHLRQVFLHINSYLNQNIYVQSILRRIQQREPTYDHYHWQEEARKNQEYADNIMEYKQNTSNSSMRRGASASSLVRPGTNMSNYSQN